MRSLVLETRQSLADPSGAIVSLVTAREVGWPDGAGMSGEQIGLACEMSAIVYAAQPQTAPKLQEPIQGRLGEMLSRQYYPHTLP